ncbi:hypothetical protein [Paraburkholderia sp. SIMBA_054]|uniref:hypothetical protein n=1 Tax=Paraburkholderia sp. SIMBA_054 TaxID=3085795 RepID=UPI00397851D0
MNQHLIQNDAPVRVASAILVFEDNGVVKHAVMSASEGNERLKENERQRKGGSIFIFEDDSAQLYYDLSPDLRSRVEEAKVKLRRSLHWQAVMDKHGVPQDPAIRASVAQVLEQIVGETLTAKFGLN